MDKTLRVNGRKEGLMYNTYNSYNELLDSVIEYKMSYLNGRRMEDVISIELPIETKDNKNLKKSVFKSALEIGNRWEDTILYNLEEKGEISRINKNDDGRFDIQCMYKSPSKDFDTSIRLEVKYHTNKYGNILVVTYGRGRYEGWLKGTSDLYVAIYIVEDTIYYLYFKVCKLWEYLDDDDVWRAKGKWFPSKRDNTKFWGYQIPFEDFKDKCEYIETRQMTDEDRKYQA